MKTRSMTHRASSGFTLIELLAVIAILGLLMGFVAISVAGRLDKAKVSMAELQIKSFENALNQFYYNENRYPRTDEGLDILAKKKLLEKDYVPLDPWKHPFAYYWGDVDPNKYTIICYGKDGQPGGEDVNADITNHSIEAKAREQKAD